MDYWVKILKQFHNWTPPLRPSPEDVSLFTSHIKQNDKTLLLGVTEELMPFANIAIDNCSEMVERNKPIAILGNWQNIPFASEFDTIIGDGCLNVFQGKQSLFFEQVKKALKPWGKLVLRVFTSPKEKEDIKTIIKEKEKIGFHAFKWRLAQHLASPYIPVKELLRVIQPIWDHPTLSIYENSEEIYYFPKLSDLPFWDEIQFPQSYPLADRCPIITWNNESL